MPKKRKRKRTHGGDRQASETEDSDTSLSSSQEQHARTTRDPTQAGPSNPQGSGQDHDLLRNVIQALKKQVTDWYPLLKDRTYFLPPVFMARIQRSQKMIGRKSVLVNEPPEKLAKKAFVLEKDVREDKAHIKVLSCLEKLPQNEVMFVISKLQFYDYLGDPQYKHVAFRRANDAQSPYRDDGDFDILIIHKKYGIMAAEIKAVGDNAEELGESPGKRDNNLVKRIDKAITQMQRCKDVLEYLVSNGNETPRILTTLMLPNISDSDLQRVLAGKIETREMLCEILGVNTNQNPIDLCLTADDLKNPTNWWQRLEASSGEDPAMSDSVYLDLVSRFGGPATIVTVPAVNIVSNKHSRSKTIKIPLHTRGNGVAECAKRVAPPLSEIVLNRRQVDILENRKEKMVYLTGPPGTGKTLVVIIKALDWLSEGKAVQVVSSVPEGEAAAHMVFHEVSESAGSEAEEKIKLHHFDLRGEEHVNSAAEVLVKEAENGELYIIADEMGRNFGTVCALMKHRVQELNVWAASIYHKCIPSDMTKEALTEALRTTPRITGEVSSSGHMSHQDDVYKYKANPISPPPCEGPLTISIIHDKDEGHSGKATYDCYECGEKVASTLRELHVEESGVTLNYRKVFVLTAGHALHEGNGDSSDGASGTSASGFLQGLTRTGIPARVLTEGATKEEKKEVATMTGPDQVVVAECRMVSGLERPVVVWVQGDLTSKDEHDGRLHAISRCTSQLIWVRRR
ncbi:uncharacterized protein [Littorina saxatilis]|uniref:Uncharacterized protein n=2 Tax=Littorina saxatilis TaxID=31220 RepID=A0AAN9AKY2_9CAEN